MIIKGYLRMSLIEWPGKISAVVFVPGCNFRCPFCYNKDLVLSPEKIPAISEEEIFSDLKKRRKWIDGVAVGGGEPLLQADLDKFLRRLKRMGFLTMLETNGTLPNALDGIINRGVLDRVAMDIKGPLDGRYEKTSKIENQPSKIKNSIKLILESGIEYEFRTTVVPTLHTKEDLVDLAKQLSDISHQSLAISHPLCWFLQQFWPRTCLDPKLEEVKPYGKAYLEGILSVVKKYVPNAQLRGV